MGHALFLGVLDDCSRLLCHAQWYFDETAKTLVHGVCQAFQKRALPRALMTDNGSAMVAEEVREGLRTLKSSCMRPRCRTARISAKQEIFWASVEGRLIAMLEGVEELTLELLNEATQAWVEHEYHLPHSELGCTPLERYLTITTYSTRPMIGADFSHTDRPSELERLNYPLKQDSKEPRTRLDVVGCASL